MKRVVRLTESDLTRIVKRIISESSLGKGMLKNLSERLREEGYDVKYDAGDGSFDPYIHITINKSKNTGLLIEVDDEDNFEIHYDNGREDMPWKGWKKSIDRLNSVKHALAAIKLFMKSRRR